MAARQRVVCASDQVTERGDGFRFTLDSADGSWLPAFVVRYRGRAYAYVNRCAHVSVELDWSEGRFFDLSGLYLVCSTHGAAYHPDSGRCAAGPCRGGGLIRLPVEERDGMIFILQHEEAADE